MSSGIHGFCESLTRSGDQSKDHKGHSFLPCSRRGINLTTRYRSWLTRFFKAVVMSILFSKSEVWVPTRVQVLWVHMFFLRCLRQMGGYTRAPNQARRDSLMHRCLNRCRCRVLFPSAFLAAHDVSPDDWSTLPLRDLHTVAFSEFGQEAVLRDSYPDWLKSVSDIILHPNTCEAMLSKAKCEDWWDDPTNACDEDMIECEHI